MKRTIALFLLGLLIGCSKDPQLLPPELEQPAAMNVYCQSAPDDTLYRVEYEYDVDNLITETTFIDGAFYNNRSFEYEYNANGSLSKKIEIYHLAKTETTYEYNGLNQLVRTIYKKTSYDSTGNIRGENETRQTFEYENNLLVKESTWWGGYITYEYQHGNVATMTDYTASGQKIQTTGFKYFRELKVEERAETAAGEPIYFRRYHYDNDERLTTIVEDGNTIEENFYDGNKLTEKRVSYFGVDPGASPCNGNYIYKYEF